MSTDFRRTKAHQRYTVDGQAVPGVTTILSVVAKPALIAWAWREGSEGRDYKETSRIAADIGTLAHSIIADNLRGTSTTDTSTFTPEQAAFAAFAVEKFEDWRKGKTLRAELIEMPLVSSKYGYGGTIDFYGKVGRSMELLDFKTGSGIYPEMLAQVAAYRQLLLEAGYKVKRARILRIGRNPIEGWEERTVDDFTPYWRYFTAALEMYRAQQAIGGK